MTRRRYIGKHDEYLIGRRIHRGTLRLPKQGETAMAGTSDSEKRVKELVAQIHTLGFLRKDSSARMVLVIEYQGTPPDVSELEDLLDKGKELGSVVIATLYCHAPRVIDLLD